MTYDDDEPRVPRTWSERNPGTAATIAQLAYLAAVGAVVAIFREWIIALVYGLVHLGLSFMIRRGARLVAWPHGTDTIIHGSPSDHEHAARYSSSGGYTTSGRPLTRHDGWGDIKWGVYLFVVTTVGALVANFAI